MILEEAIELSKNLMEMSEIVVVTSDTAVYLLKEISEIDVIKEHAELNKLEMFIVKGELNEDKPLKKKK